jgi:hypothetical protein
VSVFALGGTHRRRFYARLFGETTLTDSYSLAAFTKAAKNCSPILQEGEVADYLTNADYEPLLLFMHRIAAYVAVDVKNSNEFRNVDDSDFIDAAQECTIDMQTVIAAKPTKFSGYAAVTFRRRIRRYLAAVNNGGLGSYAADLSRPISLQDSLDTEEDTIDPPESTEDRPIGLGNPLDELIRLETVTLALEFLSHPVAGSNPKWDGIARDKRVAKELH